MTELFYQISRQIQQGDMDQTADLTRRALAQGIQPQDIIDSALIKGMAVVGEKFKRGKVFVPELLIAARAMNKALEILEPRMVSSELRSAGTLVIGTVKSLPALILFLRQSSVKLQHRAIPWTDNHSSSGLMSAPAAHGQAFSVSAGT